MIVATKKIGVGVIGASPLSPGWALAAHIPAIRALPELELRAVGTSRRESAEAAEKTFGVPAFDDADALIHRKDVELVVVSVKTPLHHGLIAKALSAQKMVFSEWPLASNLAQAEDLAAQATRVHVRTVIGLQARFAPAVQHARDLVAQGYVGEVLGTTLVGSGMAWGAQTPRTNAYCFDVSTGANTVSVPVMHALDAISFVLGDFANITAVSAIRRSSVRVIEDGRSLEVTAPDHIAISGTLRSGAVASAFYRGGSTRGDNLRWEINGTEGDLVLSASNGNLQVADLSLCGGRGEQSSVAPLELPTALANAPGGSGFGANTLREYAAFARDIHEGTALVPGFAYALSRHRLLAAIEQAARTGMSAKLA